MANSYPLSYVTQNLNSMMAEIFDSYEKELTAKTEEITKEIAEDFAVKLKEVTPRSNVSVSEHLADTITVTGKKKKSRGQVTKSQYVHFRKWQIAHLLEFGWTAKNGNKISRTPFIRPLFDTNREKYYNMYKEGLK